MSYTGFVCQSPNFSDSFMTLTLSYNPESHITCGYLGFVEGRDMDLLVPRTKAAEAEAAHPLLVPTIVLGNWCHVLRQDYETIHQRLREVQIQTGLMKQLVGEGDSLKTKKNREAYHEVHQEIVTQHAYLSYDTADFVKALAGALDTSLNKLKQYVKPQYQSEIKKNEVALKGVVAKMQDFIHVQELQRERMFHRVDIQLKVVSSQVKL
jgi:hypothetical protein